MLTFETGNDKNINATIKQFVIAPYKPLMIHFVWVNFKHCLSSFCTARCPKKTCFKIILF